MTKAQKKIEFRSLMARYATSSKSNEIRLELCGLIEDCYCADVIDREEYRSALAYIA